VHIIFESYSQIGPIQLALIGTIIRYLSATMDEWNAAILRLNLIYLKAWSLSEGLDSSNKWGSAHTLCLRPFIMGNESKYRYKMHSIHVEMEDVLTKLPARGQKCVKIGRHISDVA
jgi:hypothetical protein